MVPSIVMLGKLCCRDKVLSGGLKNMPLPTAKYTSTGVSRVSIQRYFKVRGYTRQDSGPARPGASEAGRLGTELTHFITYDVVHQRDIIRVGRKVCSCSITLVTMIELS